MNKSKAKSIAELVLGILFITMSVLGYYKEPVHMWEYCFLSGITTGLVFIVSFFLGVLKGKAFPDWVFLACATDIMIILIATAAVGLNLEGAFWFIHIIDPILLLAFWLIFCDGRKINKLLHYGAILLFLLVYIAVSFVRLKITGQCAFPANMILNWTPQIISLPIIVGLSVLFTALGVALVFLNRLIHKKRNAAERGLQ